MAFAVTDVEIVVALGVVLIIVYIIGSYWKHRKLTSYAHWFEERFSPKSRVKFASYGHAGLRVKCEMTDRSDGFRELHFALTLGARENLMYYPLARLMRNFDLLNFWGVKDGPVGMNLHLVKSTEKQKVAASEEDPNLRRVDDAWLIGLGYKAYASDVGKAERFLSQSSLASRLEQMHEVELIELDKDASTLRVVARLRERSLPSLSDFILSLGRSA